MSREIMQQALDALVNARDIVWNEYKNDWRHGLPTRLSQIFAMEKDCKDHDKAIAALEAELAKPEQELDYPPECTTPEMEVAYAAGWWKALEVQRNKQQALDKKADNARELGLDYEPEQEKLCV